MIEKEAIIDALKTEDHMTKVLVTAKSTTNIHNLINKTDFMAICHSMKYNVMHITSKFGAIICCKFENYIIHAINTLNFKLNVTLICHKFFDFCDNFNVSSKIGIYQNIRSWQ